jgi:hypothetical protein
LKDLIKEGFDKQINRRPELVSGSIYVIIDAEINSA